MWIRAVRLITTSESLGASTDTISARPGYWTISDVASERSSEVFTAMASTRVPSWNSAFERSLNRHVNPSDDSSEAFS